MVASGIFRSTHSRIQARTVAPIIEAEHSLRDDSSIADVVIVDEETKQPLVIFVGQVECLQEKKSGPNCLLHKYWIEHCVSKGE